MRSAASGMTAALRFQAPLASCPVDERRRVDVAVAGAVAAADRPSNRVDRPVGSRQDAVIPERADGSVGSRHGDAVGRRHQLVVEAHVIQVVTGVRSRSRLPVRARLRASEHAGRPRVAARPSRRRGERSSDGLPVHEVGRADHREPGSGRVGVVLDAGEVRHRVRERAEDGILVCRAARGRLPPGGRPGPAEAVPPRRSDALAGADATRTGVIGRDPRNTAGVCRHRACRGHRERAASGDRTSKPSTTIRHECPRVQPPPIVAATQGRAASAEPWVAQHRLDDRRPLPVQLCTGGGVQQASMNAPFTGASTSSAHSLTSSAAFGWTHAPPAGMTRRWTLRAPGASGTSRPNRCAMR
jgi:hypothetical protein